ncbi:MAG: efflux RND transporter permease subunit, partial [Pseudomonadales bacterium]|nr:efflux RND transporter permease subunit [Pseudomonadales bacterium]
MNNLARFTVSNPIYGWILILACLVGGIHGIQNIGRLEDPDFPIKVAYIITSYPGATAEEVEMEVTDRIEASLQELPQIDFFISKSVPGRSEIEVRLLEHFDDTETPQVFDELRRRVREAEMWMPPGVETPLVEDDFADVYGILYSATAQGYTNAELQDMAKDTGNRLKQVEGVAKVGIRGLQQEAIYVEFDDQRLTALGLSIDDISQSIWAENQVVDAGSAKFDGRRLMIAQRSKINGVEALARMKIGMPGSTEIIRLSDIATVKRTGVEVPHELVRLNGKPAAVISISVTPGLNVVEVGEQVDAKLREIQASLPLGIEVAPIYKQHDVVQEAINNFLKNLGISVFTVMLALMLFMGWRAGT